METMASTQMKGRQQRHEWRVGSAPLSNEQLPEWVNSVDA